MGFWLPFALGVLVAAAVLGSVFALRPPSIEVDAKTAAILVLGVGAIALDLVVVALLIALARRR